MRKTILALTVLALMTLAPLATWAEVDKRDLYGWWVIDAEFVKELSTAMEKDADEQGKQALKYFMPIVERMLKRVTLIITETTYNTVDGYKEEKSKLTIKEQNGNEFVLVLDDFKRDKNVRLENGRLVFTDKKSKTPEFHLRKLKGEEKSARKAMIEAAKRPPAATEAPLKRLTFLVNRATPKQVDQLLATQKDLLTIKDNWNGTALQNAVSHNKIDLVKKLIAAGADVNIRNKDGENLLFEVVNYMYPNRELLDYLIKQGVDPTEKNKKGSTLLIDYCVFKEDLSFLKHLLTLGIDINHVNDRDQSAIILALDKEWLGGAKVMIANGADPKLGAEALYTFVREGNMEGIKLLRSHGVTQATNGFNPLIMALRRNNEATDKILPELIKLHKNDLNKAIGKKGETALFFAKNPTHAKMLIDAGAKVDVKLSGGDTLIHSTYENLELIRFFAKHGVDLDAENKRGETALGIAIWHRYDFEFIKCLVENGASLNKSSKEIRGIKPAIYSIAERKRDDRMEILKYFVARGADPTVNMKGILMGLCQTDFQDGLRYLVKHGLSLKHDKETSYYPLDAALTYNNVEMLKLMIELGADPSVKGFMGQTALEKAKSEEKSQEIIELLEKHAGKE